MPPKSTLRRFRQLVVRWFRRHGRGLPWRTTRDPWRVLVSEFMLQQTQVSRVEDYYHRFLAAFPTVHAVARSTPDRVRESWDGLGYYRRAENLHRLAREIVASHDGTIPADPAILRRLPGVGRYTAGAVAAFAYEAAEPAVDTNVGRVIRRAFHPRAGQSARDDHRVWSTADALQGRRGPTAWALNQGLMELGALVCTARQARCEICPVSTVCATGRRRLRGRRRSTARSAR